MTAQAMPVSSITSRKSRLTVTPRARGMQASLSGLGGDEINRDARCLTPSALAHTHPVVGGGACAAAAPAGTRPVMRGYSADERGGNPTRLQEVRHPHQDDEQVPRERAVDARADGGRRDGERPCHED